MMAVRSSGIRRVLGFTTITCQALAFLATWGGTTSFAATGEWGGDASRSVLVADADAAPEIDSGAAEYDTGVSPSGQPANGDFFSMVSCTMADEACLCDSCRNGRHCQSEGCCRHGGCEPPGLFQRLAALHDQSGACWSFRSDAIILWRNAPRNRPLFNSFDPATATVGLQSLNADSLESDVLVAPRISLIRTDSCGDGIEATYFYAGNFYSERALPAVRDGYVTAAPGLFGNSWGPAGTALSTASATLLGNLQSAELNRRLSIFGGRGQFLAGFRWLQWNEHLLMTDAFASPPPPAPITDAGMDLYSTHCFNNLLGGQIGLDAVLLRSARNVRLDGLVKAGAYYNSATQRSTYGYFSNAPFSFGQQFRNGSPAACSFVGEVGLTAVIPLRQNLDFRCGYFGLWIEGLAQPTNQLSTQTLTQFDPPRGTLDTTGGVILQGLSLGLEGRW
ncbi:MAG: hypothetical protein ACKOEM_22525 [Planctomycetia bacterium]